MNTATYTKAGTGYNVTVDGELLGNVSVQGRDRWVYTLASAQADRVLEARPWVSRRNLSGALGGYSREEATASLLSDCRTLTQPLED